MKKSIAVAMAALITLSAWAEELQQPKQVNSMLQGIQKELGLSDKQTKQWGEIQQRYMAEHMKLREAQQKEIESMLSSEQQKKFAEMQQRFRERMQRRFAKQQ